MAFPIMTREEARGSARAARSEFTREWGIYMRALRAIKRGREADVQLLASEIVEVLMGKWTTEVKTWQHLYERDQMELRQLGTRNREKLDRYQVDGLVELEKEMWRLGRKRELLSEALPGRVWD